MRQIELRPLRTSDPVADAEYYASKEYEIVGRCAACDGNVYKGIDYIKIGSDIVHNEFDCILNYVRQNYLVEE